MTDQSQPVRQDELPDVGTRVQQSGVYGGTRQGTVIKSTADTFTVKWDTRTVACTYNRHEMRGDDDIQCPITVLATPSPTRDGAEGVESDDEFGYFELGRSFYEEFTQLSNGGNFKGFICCCSPVEILVHLINERDEWKSRCVQLDDVRREMQADIEGLQSAIAAPPKPAPDAMRKALEAARRDIVFAIAFLGRDAGSERLATTIPALIKRLADADTAIRAAISAPDGALTSQGLCETTLSERFVNPDCRCDTYEGNLGPCKTFEIGQNGHCVYCDHEASCHPPGAVAAEPDSLVGLNERLDRLLLTATDGNNFVLSTDSAKNIVAIVREWIRVKRAAPTVRGDREAIAPEAIAEAFSDWAWNKKGKTIGNMLPHEAARVSFVAGAQWAIALPAQPGDPNAVPITAELAADLTRRAT